MRFPIKCKIALHAFYRDNQIIGSVSECHYILSQLSERASSLKFHKKEISEFGNASANHGMFMKLQKSAEADINEIDKAIKIAVARFEATVDKINKEIAALKI